MGKIWFQLESVILKPSHTFYLLTRANMHYTGNRWHLPPLLRLIRNLSMSDIHSSFNWLHKGWIERDDLPCGKDFNISRKVRMTSPKTFNTVQNVTWKDKSVWKWQNQEKLNNLKYFENEQLISFQTGTRFCERVKRILLKSPPHTIKVVRLLSYKGSDKILDL